MVDFLNLPGELRNRVYRFCFVLDLPVHVSSRWTPKDGKKDRPSITKNDATSQFLSVCRQVYQEAMPILYSENKIYFNNFDYIQYFRRVIGEKPVACVTNIKFFEFWKNVGPEKLNKSVFEEFPALEKLSFCAMYYAGRREEQLPKVSELQPGTIVSDKSKWFKPDPHYRLHLSRELSDWFLARQNLEVTIQNTIYQSGSSGSKQYELIRIDYYRLIPTPKTSEPKSSQIGENYDLEFTMSGPL
ncbi:hypothetical protein BLS_005693 [Venturia inaequalis]|uniref:2EXR domain-containing protein n=1 Tax=Venturia inaequalis TaxID=5025 RepID=A0A8H3V9I1_VENIN|nr:hypothetical protein BLS_005693 [Venturia inaequalis]KAE9993007.1 hypothetical protein EG327_006976 [Venturia inaequalis]